MKRQLRTLMIAVLLATIGSACAGAPSAGSVRSYTLDTCVVTDNRLGSMGDPITKVYGEQEVKFCCKPCIKEFEADPDRYLKKLGK